MSATSIIQHILVPHDFSETAEKAFDFALDLAEKLGARLTVLHAYEVPTYAFPEGPVLTVEMIAQIERASSTALEGVVSRAGRRSPAVKVKTELRHGTAWREIDQAAQDLKVDLIVLGTHGRRGLARALLGSVAEKVVRTSACPVLTVRGGEAAR
jgi:nucleotide-binding universal stress UspA family protein